jgi:hypothetical protein
LNYTRRIEQFGLTVTVGVCTWIPGAGLIRGSPENKRIDGNIIDGKRRIDAINIPVCGIGVHCRTLRVFVYFNPNKRQREVVRLIGGDNTGKVIGTITQTDLFRVLIALTGVGVGGIQFGFQVEDKPGSIKEVADIIRQYGGRMVSILTSYDGVADGYRHVYIRMRSIERLKLQSLKDKLSEKAALLYMIDHKENKREIFSEHLK